MPINQDSRSIAINTPLGANVVGLRAFSVQEQLSRLFQIEAELSSENGEVVFDKVVGHNVTIRMQTGQSDARYFNGIVSRLVQVSNQGAYAHYRATIVPWLWLLTRTADCRIWVAKEDPSSGQTVPQIIEAVFKLHGFNDYKLSLTGTYPKREFCVQYRETDFNFVSRLMEQEGIYYYFEHENGKHTLVLADSISAHKPFPGYAEVAFYEAQHASQRNEIISDWTMEKEVQPVATALNDFDFKKPKTSLRSTTNVSRQHGAAQFEIYDYPGEYLVAADGDKLAQVRLDELQSQYEVLHGQASARGMVAGCTFKLKKHPRDEQNRDYLITGVSLHADAGEFGAQASAAGGSGFFSCNLTAIAKTQQFRPARLTPKPIVQGPQTAIVVGPGGEEIYTDDFARVKVHFHWDRHDKSDQNSSCWVRVSQSWAGKTWGSMHIPRLGQEVIVEFLEGDPDRPIITGRVYNGDQTVPYTLPANKTQSGLKSRSSKGGSSSNFNEIRFEDKQGSEELFVQAEKNLNATIKADETRSVGHDQTITVQNKQTVKVEKGPAELFVDGDNRVVIVKKQYYQLAKSIYVESNDEYIHLKSGADYDLNAATLINLRIADSPNYVVIDQKGSVAASAASKIEAGVAGNIIQITDDGKIQISAGVEIQLVVGSNSITIDASGVHIKGTAIDAKADAAIKLNGATVQLNG